MSPTIPHRLPPENNSGFRRRGARSPVLLVPVLTLLLLAAASAGAADDNSIKMENKEVELQNLRSKIQDVRSGLDSAKTRVDAYMKELQAKEKAAAETAEELRKTEAHIREHKQRLGRLQQQADELKTTLKRQRQLLAAQIRSSYESGGHDFLKLLLNQENPALVGRMVAYNEYYNRARARRIQAVQASLEKLHSLQSSISEETRNLESLRDNHRTKLAEYRKYRVARQKVISDLQAYVDKQGRQLQHLQHNEKELSSLINRLKSEQTAVQAYEDLPPFGSLKGKLGWPISGKHISNFGDRLRGGKLRSRGVRIAAAAGTDVHAISGGRVIYADWFRNMGLLLIIDHGNGYMSLYGNNERLMKKPGDMVSKNEVIAKVGDTGGQQNTGLYFEIRRKGHPLNPSLWCRR